jgi:hypothetical protein
MSTIKVNKIEKRSGSTLTLGGPGTAVTLACGSTQTGFGRTGTVNWCTTAKTSPLTAVSGNGYFINTSGGVVTVTLPSSPSAGDIVALKDYASTWNSNNLTIGRGGSNLNGSAACSVRNTNNESLTLIYVDGTEGWLSVEEGTGFIGENFVSATGGNATFTCGNFKTHVFTATGTFTVDQLATSSPLNVVDYVVVAGGGGAGTGSGGGGGGGAGGFRLSNGLSIPAPTMSPLSNPSSIPVSVQSYTVTVGAGGAGMPDGSSASTSGSASVFSSITSAGGGGAGGYNPSQGQDGGSGGGGGDKDGPQPHAGGTGNQPPVSPAQGTNGGSGFCGPGPDSNQGGGGGGGAAVAGTTAPSAGVGGAGGTGSFVADAFMGPGAPSYGAPGPVSSTRYFAGGGGGAGQSAAGAAGTGGGGAGGIPGCSPSGNVGTVNTGGGAGGGRGDPDAADRLGGSGIVMIRYRYQ